MNSIIIKLIAFTLVIFSVLGCGVSKRYTQAMIDERPLTILILPPMNETTAADAPLYFSTTIFEPLLLDGYYVLPYDITSDILFSNGFIDSSDVENGNLESFKKYFGADAVLFTRIKKWDLAYFVFNSSLTIIIDYKLVSTETGETLWSEAKGAKISLSSETGGGGLGGLIVSAISASVNTLAADYTPHARNLNFEAFISLPFGKYHAEYLKDVTKNFK